MSTKQEAFRDSWFNKDAKPERVADPPAESDDARPLEREGRLGWALALAAMSGAIGGAVMLIVASEIARRSGMTVDVVRTVGRSAPALGDPFRGGIMLATMVGALVGMLFGVLLRYSLRIIARVLAGVLLASSLWTFVHAFLFQSLAPASLGALPFGPMIAGVAVYGLLVAIVPPPRKPSEPAD